MTRAEKIWALRQRCIKANDGVLWSDHGDVLKRVIRQGIAVPTEIGLTDVLLTWKWVCDKRTEISADEVVVDAFEEIAAQIKALWNSTANDLTSQSDKCIDFLADHMLVTAVKPHRNRNRRREVI